MGDTFQLKMSSLGDIGPVPGCLLVGDSACSGPFKPHHVAKPVCVHDWNTTDTFWAGVLIQHKQAYFELHNLKVESHI